DDAKIHDGIDLDRYVVTRDHVLWRHVHHDRAQVDPHPLLNGGNDQDQSRPFHFPEAAQHEHDAALVFAEDAKRGEDEHGDENHETAESHSENHSYPLAPWLSGITVSTRPLRAVTRTSCPRLSGTGLCTCHCSLWMRAHPSEPL